MDWKAVVLFVSLLHLSSLSNLFNQENNLAEIPVSVNLVCEGEPAVNAEVLLMSERFDNRITRFENSYEYKLKSCTTDHKGHCGFVFKSHGNVIQLSRTYLMIKHNCPYPNESHNRCIASCISIADFNSSAHYELAFLRLHPTYEKFKSYNVCKDLNK